MLRPWLIEFCPTDRFRTALWARFYRGKHARWTHLYRSAALRHNPRVTMELLPGDVISDAIAFTGLYERELTASLVKLARIGGVFIDVGANLGYFSLLWTSRNSRNRCIAVEASPRNVGLLTKNIQRNGLQERIAIIPLAAGKSPGKCNFDLGPAEQTGWGGFTNQQNADSIEVDVLCVDDIVHDEDISLLKIDVEGADTWVLMGCEKLLKAKRIRNIWYEQNKSRMAALGIQEDEAQKFLRSLGYSVVASNDERAELVQWCATLP